MLRVIIRLRGAIFPHLQLFNRRFQVFAQNRYLEFPLSHSRMLPPLCVGCSFSDKLSRFLHHILHWFHQLTPHFGTWFGVIKAGLATQIPEVYERSLSHAGSDQYLPDIPAATFKCYCWSLGSFTDHFFSCPFSNCEEEGRSCTCSVSSPRTKISPRYQENPTE